MKKEAVISPHPGGGFIVQKWIWDPVMGWEDNGQVILKSMDNARRYVKDYKQAAL